MLGASFDFGAAKVDTKSNEKTAIPELFKSIDLTNSIITIDAIAREQKNTDLIVQTIAKVSINKLAIDLSCSLRRNRIKVEVFIIVNKLFRSHIS